MSDVTDPRTKDVALRRARKAAGEVHASAAAEKAARAAKDITAFETAIRRNLNAKHDFAAEYKTTFSAGRPDE